MSIPVRRARAAESARALTSVRTGVWIAGFLLICFVYFLPRWHDWNQDARMDMTLSVVNHAVINIDAYASNTFDRDQFGGHYYSNKAPGQSLFGVPVYLAFKGALAVSPVRALANHIERNTAWNVALQDAFDPTAVGHSRLVAPKLDFAMLQYLEAVFTAAVPSVLFLLFFFWFLGYFSTSLFNRSVLTLALGLGTIIFPYSQMFYSHVPAAILDFLGFALIFILGRRQLPARHGTRWLVDHPQLGTALAGFVLGLSVVFEYPATLIVLMVGLFALTQLPLRLIPFLILGALPPLAVVMSYNYAAYHNPLTTGYGCNDKYWPGECKGIGGFTLPPAGNAITGLSVGDKRGILFVSPFLVLAFPGYVLWLLRSRRSMAPVITCFAIPIVFLIAISCYWGWDGGTSVGPRYLMELVPFLALPIIFVLDRLHGLSTRLPIYLLIAASLINIWVETIGGHGYPPHPQLNPLFLYSFPNLFAGQLPLNLGMFLGLTGGTSAVPLVLLLLMWSAAMLLPYLPSARRSLSASEPSSSYSA